MEETNEITLQEIFGILWSKVLWIILISILGGSIAFGISHYVIKPMYTSRISMYVNSNTDKSTTVASLNDINASQKLVSTYIEILKSDKVLGHVIEEANLPYTQSQLRQMITANGMSGTEIFEVKVTTKNPQEAARIANTIAEVAPVEIIRVVKAGSVELIDEAIPATKPTSPNVALNTIIGLLLGGVVSVLGVLVLHMLDGRVKSEEDLKKHCDYPVLGTIPNLEQSSERIK